MLKPWPIPVFSDNYVWVLQSSDRAEVAVVDPGDGVATLAALDQRALIPGAILVTHHHADHVGGIDEILDRHPVPVFGPAAEAIETVDRPLTHGDTVDLPFLELRLSVIGVPGHTAGHIAYSGPGFVLSGDTLFAGGCGRIFEGTADQMYESLGRLAVLGDATRVYCAHEYTVSNLMFAVNVEPGNDALRRRLADAGARRELGEPTLPSTLAEEHLTNPFLRCHVGSVKEAAEAHAGKRIQSEAEVFAVVRGWKDGWKG